MSVLGDTLAIFAHLLLEPYSHLSREGPSKFNFGSCCQIVTSFYDVYHMPAIILLDPVKG